jgi:hypothetical protein
VTSCILLNKWQRQQEKERYQKHKYEEEKRRYEEKIRRRNKKSICESKSVHTGDVPSSDTVGMRV